MRDIGDVRGRNVVGKMHLNGAEPCPGRRFEAQRQRSISPEQPDVGGKARQSPGSLQNRFGSAPYYRKIRLVAPYALTRGTIMAKGSPGPVPISAHVGTELCGASLGEDATG